MASASLAQSSLARWSLAVSQAAGSRTRAEVRAREHGKKVPNRGDERVGPFDAKIWRCLNIEFKSAWRMGCCLLVSPLTWYNSPWRMGCLLVSLLTNKRDSQKNKTRNPLLSMDETLFENLIMPAIPTAKRSIRVDDVHPQSTLQRGVSLFWRVSLFGLKGKPNGKPPKMGGGGGVRFPWSDTEPYRRRR